METIYLSREALGGLFVRHTVWESIGSGDYTCRFQEKVRRPVKAGHSPSGGSQLIHLWRDLFGRHVATTHMVVDADGWPVHWDEKDLVVEGVKYVHSRQLDTPKP